MRVTKRDTEVCGRRAGRPGCEIPQGSTYRHDRPSVQGSDSPEGYQVPTLNLLEGSWESSGSWTCTREKRRGREGK